MRLTDLGVVLAPAVALSLSVSAAAQPPPAEIPRFERVDIPGLAHGSITALAQDEQGFLWIGTRDGLSRWDGYDVLPFRPVPGDPTSLSNAFVASLYLDRDDRLWVGTDDGLNRYEPATRSFARYELAPREGGAADEPAALWSIHEAIDGTLWVGASRGLYRLDPVRDVFEPMGRRPDAISLATPTAASIRTDPDGRLWVLATGYPQDASAARLYRARFDDTGRDSWDEFEMERVDLASYSFFIDSRGRFWTGGIIPKRPDPTSRRLVRVGAANDTPETARAFVEDRRERIWIGTAEGLFVHLPGTEAATAVPLQDNASWLGDYIGSLLEDDAGTLWVGTNAGLFRSDPATKAFNHVGETSPQDPERGLGVGPAAAIVRDAQGDIWVGTWGGGVDRIDAETGLVRRYAASTDPSAALPEAAAVFLLVDSRGRLWASANEHLCQYMPSADTFRCHAIPEGDGTMRWIWGLAEGPSGRLFAGTNYSGVFECFPERGEFRPFPDDPKARAAVGPNAFTLATQPDGVLWVGGMQGTLARVDLATGAATRTTLRDAEGRRSGAVHEVLQDSRGRVWVGTGTGLFVLPAGGGEPRHYTQADGLPGSFVYGLLEDDRGRIWMATNRGLARYDAADPGAGPSRTYDLEDGIGSMEFNRHARFRADDGTLYFGGATGVTWFDPDAIAENRHIPPVVMTSVRITDRDGNERVVAGTGGVTFGPADHAVSFEFSALSYTAPAKNRYRYRLEGFDEGWVEAGGRRFVTYTNIPIGDYVFRVKGSNNDGVWNEQGLAVPISALPATWETWVPRPAHAGAGGPARPRLPRARAPAPAGRADAEPDRRRPARRSEQRPERDRPDHGPAGAQGCPGRS